MAPAHFGPALIFIIDPHERFRAPTMSNLYSSPIEAVTGGPGWPLWPTMASPFATMGVVSVGDNRDASV